MNILHRPALHIFESTCRSIFFLIFDDRMKAPEPEVPRLERKRENILEGVRKGYEHAHLLLRRAAPEHATAGMDGRQAALEVRRKNK